MSKNKYEFVAFSDLHAHNFKYGAQFKDVDGVSYNTRFLDTIQALDTIRHFAGSISSTMPIFFGGDLFHTRQSVVTPVFNAVFNKVKEIAYTRKVFMLVGNHDYADRHGHSHSLEAFKAIENVTVFDPQYVRNYHFYEDEDVVIHPIPYSDSLDQLKEWLQFPILEAVQDKDKPRILFGHFGIQGAKVGSDYVLVKDSDLSVSDLSCSNYDISLFGHYHEHQQVFDNGFYIGATEQHNWGDVNGTRGYLHVSLENGKYQIQRKETYSPKFIEYTGEQETISDSDFVMVRATSHGPELDKLKEQFPNLEVRITPTKSGGKAVDFSSFEYKNILSDWLSKTDKTEAEQHKLLQQGLDYLSKVS